MQPETQRQHTHFRYTVYLTTRHWWGGRVTLIIDGTGSSLKDSELLIFLEGGGFMSINYARVIRMVAKPLGHGH